jgi:hypothetical protein
MLKAKAFVGLQVYKVQNIYIDVQTVEYHSSIVKYFREILIFIFTN